VSLPECQFRQSASLARAPVSPEAVSFTKVPVSQSAKSVLPEHQFASGTEFTAFISSHSIHIIELRVLLCFRELKQKLLLCKRK
jgi:hypothetical protein